VNPTNAGAQPRVPPRAEDLIDLDTFLARYRRKRSWVYSRSMEHVPWIVRIGRTLWVNEPLFLASLVQ
jgi:hypothetical protein